MGAMVFFNVGWMNAYQGIFSRDRPRSGGEWVEEHGVGHEGYTFAVHRGRLA